MKKTLLVSTGLIAGFVIAAFTPLGELGSADKARALLAKSVKQVLALSVDNEETAGFRDLHHFQALIAAARSEPTGNILQNQEIVMAAGFIDPESLWAMQFAELDTSGGLTRASLGSEITTPTDIARDATGGRNISQNAPRLAAADADEKIWYANTSAMELDRLERTIAEITAENESIQAGLSSTKVSHPDYHMALCVHESNDGLIAFYSFLITMGEQGASLSDTKGLSATLEEERQQTEKHIRAGRATAAAYRQVLEALPAHSTDEARIKQLALEYYDSFLLSFEVEETLAAHLLDYPGLIAEAIQTGNPPYGVGDWVASFQELGRSRMELQAYRQTIAHSLSGPTS